MVSNSAPETVSRLIGAGVDDLVRKPFSIDRLFESVGTLSHERKPFFVSYNYVGPTRRTGHRALEPASQIIRVPNTARSRAIDMVGDEELARIVDNAIKGWTKKQLEFFTESRHGHTQKRCKTCVAHCSASKPSLMTCVSAPKARPLNVSPNWPRWSSP